MTAILETSPKLFVHHMNAMRMHYKKNPDVAYALPLRLTKATLKVASTGSSEPVVDQGEQEVNAACIAWKEDTLAWNKAQENSVNAGVDALRATSDTRSFEEDMNKKREQSKQQMNDSIDRYYDRLIETGKQYPATQGLIL